MRVGRAGRHHDCILQRAEAYIQSRQRERSGTSDVLTGDVEYTVIGEGRSNVQLIFDYFDTRFSISPSHYKPWTRADALAARRHLGVDPARYRLCAARSGHWMSRADTTTRCMAPSADPAMSRVRGNVGWREELQRQPMMRPTRRGGLAISRWGARPRLSQRVVSASIAACINAAIACEAWSGCCARN